MPLMLFLVLWQLHTTQKSQVFPLSLQLKGQPARYLDSPAPMTGGGPHLPHVATGDSVLMGGALPWGTQRVLTAQSQMSCPVIP